MEHVIILMVINMKEILVKILSMVLVKWFTTTKANIMVNGIKVRNKDKAFIFIQTKMYILVIGVMERSMEKVHTFLKQLK